MAKERGERDVLPDGREASYFIQKDGTTRGIVQEKDGSWTVTTITPTGEVKVTKINPPKEK